MSEEDEEKVDPLLDQARDDLWRALMGGKEKYILPSIEALIDVKLAIMIEKFADRVKGASGAKE